MKHLFDSSSIINLCSERKIERLLEGCTLNLAFYELGNAIWKQVHLHKALTQKEGSEALAALTEVYRQMRELHVEDTSSILNVAVEEGLTYYDAAYLHAAIKNDAVLVTDDRRLHTAASKHVETATSEELN
ncbi:PIN domain-containing protein [archaeon]|nr:PIN domain-containing protein [archaeon]